MCAQQLIPRGVRQFLTEVIVYTARAENIAAATMMTLNANTFNGWEPKEIKTTTDTKATHYPTTSTLCIRIHCACFLPEMQ